MIPMTEITPEDLRVKAESVIDPMVARMLNEAADCIDSLRSETAVLRDTRPVDQIFDRKVLVLVAMSYALYALWPF